MEQNHYGEGDNIGRDKIIIHANYRIETFLFSLGISLSFIGQILPWELKVQYMQYSSGVRIIGISLIFLAIFLSFFKELGVLNKSGAGKSKSGLMFLISLITSTLQFVILGLIGSAILNWVLLYILNKWFSNTGFALFLNSVGYSRLIPAMVGLFIGSRFRYIYGDDFTGSILGGFLGFASSYYFPADFEIPFLPDWLSQPPIIVSSALSGLIGAFTSIFEEDFKAENKKKQEQLEIQPLNNEEKLEQFEEAIIILRSKGYEVYTNNLQDKLFTWVENAVTLNKNQNLSPNANTEENFREKMNEMKKAIDAEPGVALMKLIFSNIPQGKITIPPPPYRIFDNKGLEIQKFSTVNGLHKFALNLGDSNAIKKLD